MFGAFNLAKDDCQLRCAELLSNFKSFIERGILARRRNGQPSGKEVTVQQRFLTDDELGDARTLIGWQFWAGPISSSVLLLVFAWYAAREEDVVTRFLFLGIPGIFAAAFWLIRVRQYKQFAADIEARVVDIVQGVPQHVRLTRGGRCYLSVEGRDICVHNEYYKELKEANAAKIEFLPASRLATKVTVIRGIGIGA